MRLALAAAAAALLLTGCSGSGGPPSADDPRDGRVTITWSNCATGSCIYDWKACVGPDLIVSLDGDRTRIRKSPECAARSPR